MSVTIQIDEPMVSESRFREEVERAFRAGFKLADHFQHMHSIGFLKRDPEEVAWSEYLKPWFVGPPAANLAGDIEQLRKASTENNS